jgi:hypothetical protein
MSRSLKGQLCASVASVLLAWCVLVPTAGWGAAAIANAVGASCGDDCATSMNSGTCLSKIGQVCTLAHDDCLYNQGTNVGKCCPDTTECIETFTCYPQTTYWCYWNVDNPCPTSCP